MKQARWLLLLVLALLLTPVATHRSVVAQTTQLASCEPVARAAATPAAGVAPLVAVEPAA